MIETTICSTFLNTSSVFECRRINRKISRKRRKKRMSFILLAFSLFLAFIVPSFICVYSISRVESCQPPTLNLKHLHNVCIFLIFLSFSVTGKNIQIFLRILPFNPERFSYSPSFWASNTFIILVHRLRQFSHILVSKIFLVCRKLQS